MAQKELNMELTDAEALYLLSLCLSGAAILTKMLGEQSVDVVFAKKRVKLVKKVYAAITDMYPTIGDLPDIKRDWDVIKNIE